MPAAAEDLSRDPLLSNFPRDAGNRPCAGGIPLNRRLGQGGMGAVYHGVHPRLGVEVAVKVLPFHLVQQEPSLVARFASEARMAATLSSDHLVRVLDVNQENGTHFLVMEFVEGDSAGAILRRRKAEGKGGLPEDEALEILRAAAKGLAEAHRRGIVHRDVKPDNILVPGGDPRRAKLADLGLAKPEGDQHSLGTMSYVAMGTPGYMAPEQAENAKSAGAPADVFAMGATLYALLSGRAPFSGTSLMGVLRATAEKAPDPLGVQVRPGTQAILERCLDKNPARRFPSAGDLLQALEAALSPSAIPTLLTAPPPPKPATPPVRPVPPPAPKSGGAMKWVLVLGCLGILLAGGAVAALAFVWYALEEEDDLYSGGSSPDTGSLTVILNDEGTVRMNFVAIPGGAFVMGESSNPAAPPHQVTLTQGFRMQTTEVTRQQWLAVMGTAPAGAQGLDLPVTYVSWHDVQQFLNRIAARVGNFRADLPTEAEWEYACRAGSSSPWPFGDFSAAGTYAWGAHNSGGQLQTVGSLRPNAWGLHDMPGNVWEWCSDSYNFVTGDVTDPFQAGGDKKCLRGGAAASPPEWLMAGHRNGSPPESSFVDVGFRVVLRGVPHGH